MAKRVRKLPRKKRVLTPVRVTERYLKTVMTVTLRLPAGTWASLQDEANNLEMSLNALIIQRLSEARFGYEMAQLSAVVRSQPERLSQELRLALAGAEPRVAS